MEKGLNVTPNTTIARSNGEFRLVVLPVDDSELSERAFDYYFSKCWRSDDRLVIVHVFVPPPLPAPCYEGIRHADNHWKVVLDSAEKARLMMKQYQSGCNRLGVRNETRLLPLAGSVEETLMTAINELRPSLTVIGCRGMKKLQASGRVRDYILKSSKYPVAVASSPETLKKVKGIKKIFVAKQHDRYERLC